MSRLADHAGRAPSSGIACWRVEGPATPQLPLRILGLLAQRDRLFTACAATVQSDMLTLAVTAERITDADATLIAEKMRAIVGITHITLDWTPDRGD